MAEESDLLSTPAGYATPSQTKAVREYAQALLYGSGQQPVKHWTQGLSNMVSALVGGHDLYKSGLADRGSDLYDANKVSVVPGDTTKSLSEPLTPPRSEVLRNGAPTVPSLATPGYNPPGPTSDATGSMFGGMPGWAPGERPMAMGDAPGGGPMAFNGDPSNVPPAAPDAPSAIAQALAGRPGMTPPVPGVGPPTKMPTDPQTGQPIVPPGLVPYRTPVTRDQLVNTLASKRLDPEVKKLMLEQYYGQNQPLQMGIPGGSVLINPKNPSQQMPMYDVQKGNIKAGDTEVPAQWQNMPGPDGKLQQRFLGQAGGSPVAAPSGSGAPASKEGAPPSLGDVPGLLKFAGPEGGTSGLPDIITKGPEGMLGTQPPAPDTKLAQALPAGIPSMVGDLKAWSNRQAIEKDVETKQRENINSKDFDSFDKKYTAITDAGEAAAKSLPQLDLMDRQVDDPRYYSGPGADYVRLFKQLQSKFGSDPNAAGPMELFNKLSSGAILGDMRSTLQGLGQVRVAEINLLTQAMANQNITPAANHAVIDIMRSLHKQADVLSDWATAYRNGWRMDAKGNAYKTNEVPTFAGLNEIQKRLINSMPAISEEKRKNYEQLFAGHDPKRAAMFRQQANDIAAGKQPQGPASSPEEEARRRGLIK